MSARTLGVVGTLVWDRIVGPAGEAVEDWGGIAYALAAIAATLPREWSIRAIVKVGADMAEEGRRFLAGVPRVDTSATRDAPEPNNRVELRYDTPSRRSERLTGGVPGWSWDELAPALAGCDALYVNFISGFEMDLDTAGAVRDRFHGPVYADLHSLLLGKDAGGRRVHRPLPQSDAWLRCFDAVQVNEDELGLLSGGADPWERIRGALGRSPRLALVTLGPEGAAGLLAEGAEPSPPTWRRAAEGLPGTAAVGRPEARVKRGRPRMVRVPTERRPGDPTGCGDVWGGATFARLLAGDALEPAMAEGNRLATLNVGLRGAGGLADRFRAASAPSARGAEVGT